MHTLSQCNHLRGRLESMILLLRMVMIALWEAVYYRLRLFASASIMSDRHGVTQQGNASVCDAIIPVCDVQDSACDVVI